VADQAPGEVVEEQRRIGAYAVILRDADVLLTRLHDREGDTGRWTLPGGGVEHGEDPADTVVREVFEETGLAVSVGPDVRVFSHHFPRNLHHDAVRDFHTLRLVYHGTVPADSPEPSVLDVDGSTAEARWASLADVLAGAFGEADGWLLDALRAMTTE
jgi:8-oxo-dGTP diphosphatase